jgi:hypothetical protein
LNIKRSSKQQHKTLQQQHHVITLLEMTSELLH